MALHEPPSGAAAESKLTPSFSQHQQQLCQSFLSECILGGAKVQVRDNHTPVISKADLYSSELFEAFWSSSQISSNSRNYGSCCL